MKYLGKIIDNKDLVTKEYVDDSIEDLEIGGRNLLKDSENLVNSWVYNQATVADGVATVTVSTSGDKRIYQMPANSYFTPQPNTTYTLSVEAKSSDGVSLQFAPNWANIGGKVYTVTSSWAKYSWTFTSSSSVSTSSTSICAYTTSTSGVTIQFRNPKLEIGNKATDWTIAPEDCVLKTGSTMTGKLNLQSGQYTDAYNAGALNLGNSNIDGVNAIYMADYSDNAAEGVHFYRDSTHVDSLHAAAGTLYFTPNRQLGTSGTPVPVLTTKSSPVYMTTNVFDTNGKPYISKIDNAFFLADKRFTVTCTRTNSDSTTTTLSPSILFGGTYNTTAITALEGESISLNFNFGSGGFPGGYCEGYIILTFYNQGLPTSVSGRAYFDYNSVGWRNLTFSRVDGTTSYRAGIPYTYRMTQLEITITGQTPTGDPKKTMLSQVEYHMLRPTASGLSPFISKYSAEKIYYNLVLGGPNTGFFIDNGLTGNDHKLVGLYQNSAGTFSGLYDSVKSKWLVNTDGTNYLYNGHTIDADVPSGAKFTDTVTTVTTSGSGNAVTAISASNGALTVTKGSTFVTTGSTTHSGRLAKFSGDGVVVDGPTLGTSTTTFLRNDGTWATPSGSVPSNVLLCTGDNGTTLTVEANNGDIDCDIFTTSARNVANGLAPLDANSKVPTANLPATLSTFTNSSAVSISSGTSSTTNVVSFTLAAGYWVVNYQLRYGANGTGFRRAEIMDASSNNLSWVQSPAVDSYVTVLNGTVLLHPTASTTYRLVGMQNSGAALSIPADGGVVTAMRIA